MIEPSTTVSETETTVSAKQPITEPKTVLESIGTIAYTPHLELPASTVHVIVKMVAGIEAESLHGKPTITTVTFEDGETMKFFDTNKTPFRKGEYNTIIYVTHYHARKPLFHQIAAVSTKSAEPYLAKCGVLYF